MRTGLTALQSAVQQLAGCNHPSMVSDTPQPCPRKQHAKAKATLAHLQRWSLAVNCDTFSLEVRYWQGSKKGSGKGVRQQFTEGGFIGC